MKAPLKVLFVPCDGEAMAAVSECLAREYESRFAAVRTLEQFREQLRTGHWDMIFSTTATEPTPEVLLETLAVAGAETPLFILCDAATEDRALAAVRSGASEAIRADDPRRLVPAVARELRRAERQGHGLEQTLRETELHFLELFEHTSDAVVIFASRPHDMWVCETMNPACEQIAGLRAADCVGRNACELTPNGVPEALAVAFRSCQTGKEVVTREHPLDLPAGQRWFNTVLVPLTDANGNVRRIACIARDITDHRRNEEAVRRLNLELEVRVAERTSQLADANKELEAFSYSVSHDLRAPLRSIDGFSKALLEDCFDRLDPEGRDYLNRVRAASQRMGDLIDDLLNLSRVNRAELRRTRLDLGVIARKIADGLHTVHPDREIAWSIAPALTADADRNLLTILLDNLLGNAFKYTGRRRGACIEVGGFDDGGRMIYFVKDDGAGFDMAYAQKLFQPFQRLHRPDEFDGHGIGLATVQRIVHRHGGRIWAEGAVERGACFYFTLDHPSSGDLSLE